ncbi:MAG: ArsR family transcriptional regulator [Candidatus Thermoplasmatota archaeon]|nr:ArsR family transcriptional regulator [Candidatus Thermoplasmatota archaeon]
MTEKTLKYPSENTRTEILDELLGQDLTAIDIADILSINESAVRRHLNRLEKNGLIDSYFEKASKGRPKKYFEITEEGEKLFPKETELILNILIKSIKDRMDEEELKEIADLVAEELKEYFPEVEEKEDIEKRIEKFVKSSKELGFYSSYSKEEDHYTMKHKNCVFGDLPAEQASWICSIHRKVVSDILGPVDIEQEKSMVEGDKICLQKVGV